MSRNPDRSEKDDKARNRDTSPSAYSQSSALEWDPSADVGHEGVGLHQDQGLRGAQNDPNADEAGPSSGRPRIIRSRSYEYPMDEHQDQPHKSSLGELATQPLALVQDWMKKRYLHPDDNGASFLETMVSGFSSRREFMVQPERPVSTNSTVVNTIVPPPQMSDGSRNSSLPEDLKKLEKDIDTNHQLTRKYSKGELASKFRNELASRSHSMLELGLFDSTTAPTVNSGSGLSRYTTTSEMSLAKRNDSSGTANEASGISEWLEAGMTKSEKEYKKNKEKLHSDRSSSLIFFEVKHDFDAKNRGVPEQTVDIGVQTSTVKNDTSSDTRDSTCSSIYHSTPSDRRPLHVNFSANYDNNEEKKQTGKRNTPPPPQPFIAATRKSSHRHHHAHHSRNQDAEISALIEATHPDLGTAGTSSSDLSPPCFLLDKLVKTQNDPKSPIKKKNLVSALEIHRDYHVKKVRHELRQLEKLNQLLTKNLQEKNHRYSSSTETETQTLPENRPHSSGAHPTKVRSPHKTVRIVPKKDSSSSSSNTPKEPLSQHSLNGISNLLNDIKQSTVPGQKDSNVEKKLDELMDAFSFIAGMLLEKDNEKNNSSSKQRKEAKKMTPKKKKPIEPTPPPVSYFIPFPNCQGQYVFRKEDLNCVQQRNHIFNTESRTVSRQAEGHGVEEENEDCWEDADEDAENRDPNHAEDPCESDGSPSPINKFKLQDVFEQRCPNFLSRLREREAILARIKSERELRAEKKREWIRLYGANSRNLEELDSMLPPKGPRLMTTKEMRELTQRHYKQLPEVQEKVIQRKCEEEKKTNRIMSQVFAQQLQKGVLKGEVNFVHSRSLLRR